MVKVMTEIMIESYIIASELLKRDVIVDFYFNKDQVNNTRDAHLLFINDGQDLVTMSFEKILSDIYADAGLAPIVGVGIHCGADRRNEYGVVGSVDYKGRGSKAGLYEQFIFQELFELVSKRFEDGAFKSVGFCGFSLGGLSALDIVWRNARLFHAVGVFSGSLWWRSVSQYDKGFDEDKHRIIHKRIREGSYNGGLKFFFETGTLDETADRNGNGVIDSIDDTMALIDELEKKGYTKEGDIRYLELQDGHHDVPTWARAFPAFLKWAYCESMP